MEMTKKLQVYIRERGIQVEEVAEKTGVRQELLCEGASRALNATEFLEVCAYLKIDPKEIAGR